MIRVGTGRGRDFDYGFITGMGNTCAAPTQVWDGMGNSDMLGGGNGIGAPRPKPAPLPTLGRGGRHGLKFIQPGQSLPGLRGMPSYQLGIWLESNIRFLFSI